MSSTANGYTSLSAGMGDPAPPPADPAALANVPDPDPDEEARKRKQREASEKMVQTKKENATKRKHKEEEKATMMRAKIEADGTLEFDEDELEAVLPDLLRRAERLGEGRHTEALLGEHGFELDAGLFFRVHDENVESLLVRHFQRFRLVRPVSPSRLQTRNGGFGSGRTAAPRVHASRASLAKEIGDSPEWH